MSSVISLCRRGSIRTSVRRCLVNSSAIMSSTKGALIVSRVKSVLRNRFDWNHDLSFRRNMFRTLERIRSWMVNRFCCRVLYC